jgi:hypothetical protein
MALEEAALDGQFAALERRIDAFRADLLKWMFVFWATTILTIVGTGVAVVSLLR